MQAFHTSSGVAVTSFEIKKELFVVFANYRKKYLSYRAKLQVYVLEQSIFTLNQTLDSVGAADVEYFTIHGEHFLVVANQFDGHSY